MSNNPLIADVKVHHFGDSLKKGQAGELLFLQMMPNLVRLDGKKSDFKSPETGLLYELKSDQYNMNATENYFIERFRNDNNMTNGGPWQSVDHGTDKFVYMFVPNQVAHIFDVKKLVKELELVLPRLKQKLIRNPGYNTIGYAVPRKWLAHIIERTIYT